MSSTPLRRGPVLMPPALVHRLLRIAVVASALAYATLLALSQLG